MSKRTVSRLISILIFVLAIGVGVYYARQSNAKNAATLTDKIGAAPSGSLSLQTEPADGLSPIADQINGAKKSIDLVMYEIEDQTIEQDLVNAQSRGVSVRVLLNKGYYGSQTKANQPAFNFLQTNHVPVHWTPGYFALTHQKTMVVDGTTADIMTYNFTPQYYSTSRDFAVIDRDSKDVAAIETVFGDDWNSQKISKAPIGDDLVWSPGSETEMLNLIDSAQKTLDIYNEEMADSTVTNALVSAAQRGVNVEVTMTASSSWKAAFQTMTNAGVHIHTYAANASLYIHAKMILVDSRQAFVGSENFSTTSLSRNRELGVVLQDPTILQNLQSTFDSDYQAATPFSQ